MDIKIMDIVIYTTIDTVKDIDIKIKSNCNYKK